MTKNSGIIVTLKAAATLDGKIATATGCSKWITGEAARQKGHELRNENDAILVGINTVLTDDPELTVRGIQEGSSPVRIVLDSKARIPEQSRVFKQDGVPVVIVTGSHAPLRIWPELADLTILTAPTRTPDILWVLSEISKLGLKSLLVEGGSLIHASFIKSIDTYDVNCAAHNFCGHLGTAISAHFLASIPNLRVLEYQHEQPVWAAELFTSVPTLVRKRFSRAIMFLLH